MPEKMNPPEVGSMVTVTGATLFVVSDRRLAEYVPAKPSERTS